MDKKFKLASGDIVDLAKGHGGCIATDMITVKGYKVGYFYRDEPHSTKDSGWCFMSGRETQEYMDNPDNHAIYDVNTIANYDSDIIKYLSYPIGSAFERNADGQLVKIDE